MKNNFDTIVVGLGAMGSSAIYQLAEKGIDVLGIDQFSPPHTQGSSGGSTRITRQAIGEGKQFTPLSLRSYEIFEEIEQLTGKNLLCKSGGLMLADDTSKGVHGVADFFNNTVSAAIEFGIEHEILNAAEIRSRFPQFNVTDNTKAYYEHSAGFLYAEECINSQLMLAEKNGAKVHRNEKVQSIRQKGDLVEVISDKQNYLAQKAVVAAGPWINDFVDEQSKQLFTIERQVQFWFDIESCYEQFTTKNFPIFIWETPLGHSYGFPAIDGPSGGFKIGCSRFNKIVSPYSIDRNVESSEVTDMFNHQVRDFFCAVKDKCVKTSVCLYTSTIDANFVIDNLPGLENVMICSACSGHGFKHSAAVGECVAEILISGKSKIDLTGFKFA